MSDRSVDTSAPRREAIAGTRFAWIDQPASEPRASTLPLLLLHGFTGHRDDFRDVVPVLARHRRVIVPDLRGHGNSDSEPGPLGWTFEQLIQDLVDLLEHLGIERCDLLGHSMGGMLALRLVLAQPERVRALILMCTAPERPASLPRSGFEKAVAIAEARGMEGLQARLEKAGRVAPSAALQSWGEHYWLHQRRRFAAMSPASYHGIGTAFFDSGSLVDRLQEIRNPTLVLVGEHDLDFLPGADLFEKHLPVVERITIAGAEHHPHQENTQVFFDAVERHLDRVGETASRLAGKAGEKDDAMSGKTQDVEIETSAGETMGAYLALPEGGAPAPAVLVFMEIFGVNGHIRDVTDRLAAEGYVALAPDYFHRTAPGIQLGYDEAGMQKGMGLLGKLRADEMISDARDAIAYLRSRKDVISDRIGAIGFCIGGHMTYLTACETDIVAAASYYGGGIAAPQGLGGAPSTLGRTPQMKGRIHCYFGGQDRMIPSQQVDAIRKALDQAAVEHEIHVYPEADHGFHCDQRASYHEASARDAWQHTLALFAETLRA